MGTWAEGNFDNDGALDYLGDLINQLTSNIEDIFKSATAAGLDECGESELMPGVEIIYLLCKNCNGVPPKEDNINRWKTDYLHIFDTQIDALTPKSDYKIKRRKVIETTFDDLLVYSQEFWK